MKYTWSLILTTLLFVAGCSDDTKYYTEMANIGESCENHHRSICNNGNSAVLSCMPANSPCTTDSATQTCDYRVVENKCSANQICANIIYHSSDPGEYDDLFSLHGMCFDASTKCDKPGQWIDRCSVDSLGLEIKESGECYRDYDNREVGYMVYAPDGGYVKGDRTISYCSGRCSEGCVQKPCQTSDPDYCTNDGVAMHCMMGNVTTGERFWAAEDCRAKSKQCSVQDSIAKCQ